MNGVLLRPLPFPNPDRLFVASYAPPPGPFTNVRGLYDRDFLQLVDNDPPFEQVTTFHSSSVTLSGGGEPASLNAAVVTPEFFGVLGVAPSAGRVFASSETGAGRDNVVILSNALWRARFGAERRVIGTSITLEGRRRTIVGVMPASFDFPAHTDVWVPLQVTVSAHETRMRVVVGRLRPALTSAQAQAAWSTLAANFETAPEMSRRSFVAELIPLKLFFVGDARRPLLIFAGAVAFVLLIACANVANLLLMRVATRDREIAVRAALGAGRLRLVRQLLTEALAISALGAILGVALAVAGVRMLLALAPSEMLPRASDVHVDSAVLLFTGGLAIFTAVLCGLVPALHATEPRLRASLANGARTVTGGHGRARSLLVIGELALAIVLLTGAGLMLRSFHRMRSVDLGFRPANLLATTVDLPSNAYRSAGEMRDYQQRVIGDLLRVPGVASAAAVNWIPLGGNLIAGDFHPEGGPRESTGNWADKMVVSPDYFRTMGIEVKRGRAFTERDGMDAVPVVLISQSVASRFWPRGDAIGKRVTVVDKPGPSDWLTIVGVVGDVVQAGVTSKPDAAIYQPIAQTPQPYFLSHVTFVVRPAGDSRAIAPAMRQVLRDADTGLPLRSIESMTDLIDETILAPRFQSRMLLIFSVLALTLAVVGIYGVLAYGVAQRFHEIGIRIALGAPPSRVVGQVLRRTVALTVPGLLIGIVSSIALTRVLATYLFQVTPTDPATFAAVAVLLTTVAFCASYIPARRASRVDPLIALRTE
jgi:putative ABC transport system permease protein